MSDGYYADGLVKKIYSVYIYIYIYMKVNMDQIPTANIHRYVNYSDIQVLMMVTKTETFFVDFYS